ncbi:MAG: hypothetical protein ACFFAH_00585 [Promethearchaeota archaeon]
MESLSTVSKLEIPIGKVLYDKKSKILSIDIFGFVFVGNYKKSSKISEILDDIYASLKKIKFERSNLYFLDKNNLKISEKRKLTSLKLKEKIEKEEKKPEKREIKITEKEKKEDKYVPEKKLKDRMRRDIGKKKISSIERERDVVPEEELLMEESAEDFEVLRSAPVIAKAPAAPGGGPAISEIDRREEEEREVEAEEEEPKPTTYIINMGFQYYSVMMEQKSYLFYVYFSHEELKIVDEEGKTIYKTTLTITTLKKEPPILDLRIEGEGFEVHPLAGKVEVKKDAVNPPVMIFSVLPLKSNKKRKSKKKSERRYLNVYIDFENKTISHTVLSVIVQPKHFHLEIGPLKIDISKPAAIMISLISVLFAMISTIYSIITFETSSLTDMVSGFVPGLASFIFFAVFIISLIKGIYPLKQKWSSLLNFDKTSPLIK